MSLLRAALLLAVAGLAGCGIFGGDKDIPDDFAPLSDISTTVKVKRLWTASVGDGTDKLRLGLLVATDGTAVYAAAHDGQVAAFDALSGKRRWRRATRLPLAAGPAVGDGIVVAGSSDGDVIALGQKDGEPRWSVSVSSEVLSAPAVAHGIVVVRTVDGRLRGLAVEDGTERWVLEQEVPPLTLRGNAPPVISGDRVFAGLDSGKLIAAELRDGQVLWEAALGSPRGRNVLDRMVDVDAVVRVVGNDVYSVGFQGRAAMLAIESGQLMWSREISSYSGLGADLAAVYVGTASGEVLALDRQNGATLWTQEGMRGRRPTAPVPYGRSVVVGDFEGYLHWLAAEDGVFQARISTGKAPVINAPLVVGENLYVLTESGSLQAYTTIRPPEKKG